MTRPEPATTPAPVEPIDYLARWSQIVERRRVQMEAAYAKAGMSNVTYSVTYLAIVAGAVLAVTLWWIRHNTGIYRRKGQRTGRPTVAPRTDEDRLGRPLRWQLEGGAPAATAATHLVIELDGAAKVYVEAA